MPVFPPAPGVQFPASADQPPALALLKALLSSTATMVQDAALPRFPDIPAEGSARRARRAVAELLTAFEIGRATSPRAREVAAVISECQQRMFVVNGPGGSRSVQEEMSRGAAPLGIRAASSIQAMKQPCWPTPTSAVSGDDPAVVERRHGLGQIDDAAAAALRWTFDEGRGVVKDLRGHKFALLGGTAELSPIGQLLAAGADVFTTHSTAEAPGVYADPRLPTSGGGRLHFVPGGVDLLTSPAEIAETIRQFAGGDRIHLGMFAYRGGEGREWRLSVAMDGIARYLHKVGVLGSVAVYQSPSVPTEVSAATLRASTDARTRGPRGWPARVIRMMSGERMFGPNIAEADGRFWARSAVPEQGISYLVSNLFGKRYGAECFAAGLDSAAGPLRVSANTAPITFTCSTAVGAARSALPALASLGIDVFDAATVRRWMYRLMLADLFGPQPPHGTPAVKLVHGGVFTHPYPLATVLRIAYILGKAGISRDTAS